MIILNEFRAAWESGHRNALLEIMSRGCCWDMKHETAALISSSRFFASSTEPSGAEARLQHESVLKEWRKHKLIELPGYFAMFGVQTIATHLKSIEEKARDEALLHGHRNPSRIEFEAIKLLQKCLSKLAPEIAGVFSKSTTHYSIGKTDVLLGQLKSTRSYRSKEVYFSQEIFAMPFGRAVAVFLHEHAHIFGFDGNRGFSDSLTELLEQVIQHRELFDSLEQEWRELTLRVQVLRLSDGNEIAMASKKLKKLPTRAIEEWLLTLPVDVISNLPTDLFKNFQSCHE